MNDQPLAGDFPPNQRKVAADRFFTVEFPAPEHESGGIAEGKDLQIGEGELAHRLAVGVSLEIALAGGLQPRSVLPPEEKVRSSLFQ